MFVLIIAYLFTVTCYGIAMNVKLNDVDNVKVSAENMLKHDSLIGQWDVILVGDMFNDPDTTRELLPWLRTNYQRDVTIIIGDPGTLFRSNVNQKDVKQLKHYFMPDVEVEKQGHITTEVWRFCG